jgi:LL-diaminopimelate aminotransferase
MDKVPPYLFKEISRIKAEAIAASKDVIDLGIGDPDQPTPAAIVAALQRAAERPETHRYDETQHGWHAFLNAAARWMERQFGVSLDPQRELVEVIGSKEGLGHLCWAYLEPGDVAIVPDPGYTVYKVNALLAGAEAFEVPLRKNTGFLPVLEDIPTDVARRAKTLTICYPNNPTGAVATEAFLGDCVRFCRENDILLINDMAYASVAYDGYRPPSVFQISGAKDVAIEFHSLSKAFNMTGWRIGFAAGNPEAVENLAGLKANLDSKAFPAIAEAGAFALDNCTNEAAIALYRRRRDLLCDGLSAIGWQVDKPVATFYVWARIPRDDLSSAEFCAELLSRASVVAIPGSAYGQEGEGYIRMSLTLLGDRDGERFAETVRRIAGSGLIPARV